MLRLSDLAHKYLLNITVYSVYSLGTSMDYIEAPLSEREQALVAAGNLI